MSQHKPIRELKSKSSSPLVSVRSYMFMDCCPSQDTQGVKLVLLSILTQVFLSLSSVNFSVFYKHTQSTALNCSDPTFAAKAAQSSLQQVRRLRGPEQLGVSTKTNPFVVTAPVSIPQKWPTSPQSPPAAAVNQHSSPKQRWLLFSSPSFHTAFDQLWLKRVCKVFHQQVELRNSILYNPFTIWIFFAPLLIKYQ